MGKLIAWIIIALFCGVFVVAVVAAHGVLGLAVMIGILGAAAGVASAIMKVMFDEWLPPWK